MTLGRFIVQNLVVPAEYKTNTLTENSFVPPLSILFCIRSASDNVKKDLVRFPDSASRSREASAAAIEFEELLGAGPGPKENVPDGHGAEEPVKLRNIDTGEDIELAEIDKRVPPPYDPGELFRAKDDP